jgi:hypothetical protein
VAYAELAGLIAYFMFVAAWFVSVFVYLRALDKTWSRSTEMHVALNGVTYLSAYKMYADREFIRALRDGRLLSDCNDAHLAASIRKAQLALRWVNRLAIVLIIVGLAAWVAIAA